MGVVRRDHRPSSTDSTPTRAQGDATGFRIPTLSLPRGGGAIRGIGEKFAANPVTGTGALSIPISTSRGRSDFGPHLSVSYDSGAGNGLFGFGWHLALPAITRKTDRGLPKYQDAAESDTFILSGTEDLVAALEQTTSGWIRRTPAARTLHGTSYLVHAYQPRIEGLFSRIERWTNPADSKDTFWRSISRDNVTTWYGKTSQSRIADPADPSRVFSWLICESYDDKGNAIVYEYKRESGKGINAGRAHERNRTAETGNPDVRSANLYPERIRYGNRSPYLPNLNAPIAVPLPASWCFETVFDYGDHDASAPRPDEPGREWAARPDPFSSYRSTFELRTYRRCRRVLMFHHFPGDADVRNDCLVRSTDFVYAQDVAPAGVTPPMYSFLVSVTQTGYQRDGVGYRAESMPPVEFEYTKPTLDETVHEVEPESLENLPAGLAGGLYQWVDLDGEGLSGVLIEQGGGWHYKRNVSPTAGEGDSKLPVPARFGPIHAIGATPSLANLAGGQQQLLDLSGSGQLALVEFQGSTPGFFERTTARDWAAFQPFASLPVLDWNNPNLKFIDLTGDGFADILITEQDACSWHASLAKDGFADSQRVRHALDEEKGPRLVLADGTESIFLADLSGDGLADLVRIRNGEVCYWPNLGYCRFGPKVTMDDAPCFDAPDLFDGRRLRLADIDGSGTTDIIYLAADAVHLYFNLSGNAWSPRQSLTTGPGFDPTMTVGVLDLLGNGTACLTWSVARPGEDRRAIRYIDLLGGQKPHLLVKVANNLGAETRIHYAPSTRFYLQDERDGRPWVTRLPFPVHCVEKVVVTDKWRKTSFSSTYSYHHGYFDGVEREFRGFGRVEQIDSESYGTFLEGNAASPYITSDKTLYQPPVKTVTWYHTGALLDRERILSQFEDEYFETALFHENVLPQPDLVAEDLDPHEWSEAFRACKGMVLRQETYELDASSLQQGLAIPVRLFTTAYHNCHIRRLQARGPNPHAVFLVAESEAITYHYDLDLRVASLHPDPRIAHTLNLTFDDYANVLQSVVAGYLRVGDFEDDAALAEGLSATLPAIHRVQRETHLAYAETRYTDDFDPTDKDSHRLRVPCEQLTYELTGISPRDANDRTDAERRYFSIDELRQLKLSDVHQPADPRLTDVPAIAYHALPKRTTPEKRIVEHQRLLFFKDGPSDPDALKKPHPLGRVGRLGLLYETYRLALTEELLGAVFASKLTADVRAVIESPARSGYLSGAALAATFQGTSTTNQYWSRSGVVGFANDAAQRFYLPELYVDAFGHTTTQQYDSANDLFIESTSDALGNTTSVTRFDFRVLAPASIKDINDNVSEAFFDVLGLPIAVALEGKGGEGDNLLGFTDVLANPSGSALATFFNQANLDELQARAWLGNATVRFVYFFGETHKADRTIVWADHPPCACGIVREQHLSQLGPGGESALQTSFEYSDGMGSVIVKKVQAEPEAAGQAIRWIASGKTICNNKGKAVKQYEPYFSSAAIGHQFEEPREAGVTRVIYYDAVGRPVRTEMPDGSFSRVEFSPWHVRTFDQNDTVKEPGNAWFARKSAATASAEERRAAQLAAEHGDTPTVAILDSLGRQVLSVSHNRVRDTAGVLNDERYVTFTRLDAEGKPLWIRDARQNLVIQYISPPVAADAPTDPVSGFVPCYDIAGNLLFQHSMDGGGRWLLNDATGKPMLGWNSRGHAFRTDYDELHRLVGSFVTGADPANANREIQFEKVIYGDTPSNDLPVPARSQWNLRGKPYQQYDTAGLVTSKGRNPATSVDEAYDFKGNLLRSGRRLVSDHKITPDWTLATALDSETFSSSTQYDALNRPIQLVAPHSDRVGATLNVIRPGYNEASLLQRVDVWLEQPAAPSILLSPATADLHAVANIDYDAKGQRTRIEYNEAGHPVITRYTYEDETYRLARLLTTRPLHARADQRTLQDLAYTYDPVGNITHVHDEAQQPAYFGNTAILPSNSYAYDALYRLTKADGREHAAQNNIQRDAATFETVIGIPFVNSPEALQRYVEDYAYDAVGNILSWRHSGGSVERWVRRYQYAVDSNRLLATRVPGDPDHLAAYTTAPGYAARYAYDAHGNMTAMPHLPTMTWDFRDQLTSSQRQAVAAGAGERTYYVYDAGGQRVRKVTETSAGVRKDERIYVGGFEVYRKYAADGSSIALERETLHVMDDKKRIALVETRTRLQGADPAPRQLVRFQLGNHLGSAILEVDTQTEIISYEEYHPYGTTAYQAARSLTDTPKRYRYTGMERDEETGFTYHGARFYVPWLGRWTTVDPAGLRDGLNAYRYSRNRPVHLIDPSGLAVKAPQEILDEIKKLHEENESTGSKIRELEDKLFRKQRTVTEAKKSEQLTKDVKKFIKEGEADIKKLEGEIGSKRSAISKNLQQIKKLTAEGIKAGLTHDEVLRAQGSEDPLSVQSEQDLWDSRNAVGKPRVAVDDKSKPFTNEPPKPEKKPAGIEPPKAERPPKGVEPPRSESKPKGLEPPKVGSPPLINVPPDQKNVPVVRSNPSGLTPEQIEKLRQADQPVPSDMRFLDNFERPLAALVITLGVAAAFLTGGSGLKLSPSMGGFGVGPGGQDPDYWR